MNSALLTAADLKVQIQQHLSVDLLAVNQIHEQHLKASSRFVADVVEHVSRYRGKQIRPILLLLLNRMIAGESSRKGQVLAAAIEMIHMATLVHDDVIDEAETRRHVATVQPTLEHPKPVSYSAISCSREPSICPPRRGDADACALIGRATDRTCEGELNQIAARLEQSNSELDYFRIIGGKTGQLVRCELPTGSGGCRWFDQRMHDSTTVRHETRSCLSDCRRCSGCDSVGGINRQRCRQ